LEDPNYGFFLRVHENALKNPTFAVKHTTFMEEKPLHLETVTAYNDLLGVETLHPLVSVIDLTRAHPTRHQRLTFGFYTVFLKEVKCGDLIYGRRYYDYQEGTVVCLAPGQVIGIEDNGETFQPRGWALCFHPDLIRGTSLGGHIKEYSYFSYEVNEALHLSQKERGIFVDCLHKIRLELEHSIDRLSRRLIATNIELLLDYCLRFYERQFVTRETNNRDILVRFESLLDDYFESGRAVWDGLPTVKWCAGELCLSPNYFGDLIKKETGKTAQEQIRLRLVTEAKERLADPAKSVSEVAYSLGFRYPQHFSRLFRRVEGRTPNDYRNAAS